MIKQKSAKKFILIAGMALLLNARAAAEEDDVAIERFDSKFALGLAMTYMGMFFQQENNPESFYRNVPLDFGVIAALDWIALQVNLSLITSFEGDFGKESFDILFGFYRETMCWELFARYYTSFKLNRGNIGEKNRDIDLSWFSGGLSWVYILDYKTHSLQSVFSLNRKQTKSSGSFLLGANAIYYNVHFEYINSGGDTERQHLIAFGPSAGYSYTWVFQNGVFLNLFALTGFNIGSNVTESGLFFAPSILPKLTAGYHGETWSINAVLRNEFFSWQQEKFIADTTTSLAFSITVMKRF